MINKIPITLNAMQQIAVYHFTYKKWWCYPIFFILPRLSYKVRVNVVKVMLGLVTAAASAATSIVYIAHKGNAGANWFAICQQYNNFCERISGSLIGSYIAVALFIILIILSVVAVSRNWCHVCACAPTLLYMCHFLNHSGFDKTLCSSKFS